MRTKIIRVIKTLFVVSLLSSPAVAQNARVAVGKHATAIPKVCEQVVPASLDGTVDVPALVKEAYCKGAGDMIIEYSYVMNSARRAKDKKGNEKVDTTTYEVFIPILKSGTRTRGILVVTSRNGVPVAANELEKERTRAGERLEKEEEKIARTTPSTADATTKSQTGMMPLGMYTHTTTNRSGLLGKNGSAALAIHTFLNTCEFTLARREQHDARDTLVFTFRPRADAQFNDNEKYIAQLNGEIWIDARERIVTRLVGWPSSSSNVTRAANAALASGERPPAVYVEMMRLPEGVWLPHVVRINGADYQELFDGIPYEVSSTFSHYIRFSSEIKDVKVGTPNP